MTNVHASIHKPTDADPADLAVPVVELCIHGDGAKYGRGLAVADDNLPAVQRLKLMLAECCDDGDDVEKSGDESDHSAYMTADSSQNVADVLMSCADADNMPSSAPVVDIMDVQELSAGCLKRSSRSQKSPAKKQRMNVNDCREQANVKDCSGTAAADSISNQHTDRSGADVVSHSLTSADRPSTESCSTDGREDRCLLNTCTGMYHASRINTIITHTTI